MPELSFIRAGAYVENLKLQVVLVLDVSGSMGTAYPDPPDECVGHEHIKYCALRIATRELILLTSSLR